MHRTITLAALLVGLVSTAHAQFLDRLTNPSVSVSLQHPPGLGLKIDKVAFGESYGECADQVVQALISELTSSGVEVIDRQNLNSILAEHDFSLSGYVDQTSAVALGQILGPSVLIFVKELRCASDQDRLREQGRRYNQRIKKHQTVTVYVARTRVFLKVSVQAVHLETGRIFAARVLEHTPVDENRADTGYPEYPAEFHVQDQAVQLAVRDLRRMLLPWSEVTQLVYFNDKDCNLRQAFLSLKAGDLAGALGQSLANLETCKNTPGVKNKTLGHAYYNVAMSHVMQADYGQAMQYFQEAAKLRPGGVISQAMGDCQRAQQLMAEMQRVEERAAVEAERQEAKEELVAKEEAASLITNDDVIQMVESGLPESIIIHKILASKTDFDTSADALVTLTQIGVSEEIIITMMTPSEP